MSAMIAASRLATLASLGVLVLSLIVSPAVQAQRGQRHKAILDPGACGAVIVGTETPVGATPPPAPTIAPTQTASPTVEIPTDTPGTAAPSATPTETPQVLVFSTSTPTATVVPTSTPSSTPTGTMVVASPGTPGFIVGTPLPTATALPATATPTVTPGTTTTRTPGTATPGPGTSTPGPTATSAPTDTPVPTGTDVPPTDTPEPSQTAVPPTNTPQPSNTPRPKHTPQPTETAQATDTPGPAGLSLRNGTQWQAVPVNALPSRAIPMDRSPATSPATPNIICVWTASDATGNPTISIPPHSAVYLLAAWHMPARSDLDRVHLTLRWDIFRGYHRDVSLLPGTQDHVAARHATVTSALRVGTFRLSSAPRVTGLKRGWYSLVASLRLTGGACPAKGCTGQRRQTRFYQY